MTAKEARRLRVGVLGCGQIAQAAHFDSCIKARNADLYAICDSAPDLLERMASTHRPERAFSSYEEMLADPQVDAVIVAVSDDYHVSASTAAITAGAACGCPSLPFFPAGDLGPSMELRMHSTSSPF